MIGKYVYYNKEKDDVLYIVKSMKDDELVIHGVYYRIIKKVNVKDVVVASDIQIKKEAKKDKERCNEILGINTRKIVYKSGKILHIDGDEEYLNRCLDLYKKVKVYAKGVYIKEDEVYRKIDIYLKRYTPDIVVITGHDMYNNEGIDDVRNYVNTLNFMRSCKQIKLFNSNIVVIAGACQSNFEALIASGADFASSPKRVNIHTYDPCVVAIKVATSLFNRIVNIKEINKYIENGSDAFSGLDTFGKMRLLQ